jgi:hypothetical protein
MVSKRLNEDDIKKMFAVFGPIEECTILRDDNGISRGDYDTDNDNDNDCVYPNNIADFCRICVKH